MSFFEGFPVEASRLPSEAEIFVVWELLSIEHDVDPRASEAATAVYKCSLVSFIEVQWR